MRKAVTLIFILVLFAAGAVFAPALLQSNVAFADASATIVCADVTVHRGQTFETEVSISGNTGLTGLMLTLKYDSSVMRLTAVRREEAGALNSLDYSATQETEWDSANNRDGIRFLWDGTAPDSSNGVLMTLTFDTYFTADVGNYTLTMNYVPENTRHDYQVPATPTVKSGKVSVTTGQFAVQYSDYDGKILFEKDYNSGDAPQYGGATPVRAEDEMYSYEFSGWKKEVSSDDNIIKFVAEYDKTPKEYPVRFYVDGELYKVTSCKYGEALDLSDKPYKENYTVVGWFTDKDCQQKLKSSRMPAHELSLYGYQKYNIREQDIPEIVLSVVGTSGDILTVEAEIKVNTGIAFMCLSLNYDRQHMTFRGFQRGSVFMGGFSFTNSNKIALGADGYYRETSGGALDVDPFKFIFENSMDSYESCGVLLRMQFELPSDAPAAVYEVGFDYDKTGDIFYFNEAGEIWFTAVDIVSAQIPKGAKDHWNEPAIGDADTIVDVKSSVGMPVNTELVVNLVSGSLPISPEEATSFLGGDKQIKSAYQISLLCDGVEVQPDGTLEIKIKLSDDVLSSKNIFLYSVSADGKLTYCQSNVVEGQLVFSSDATGTFAVVGSVASTVTPPVGGGDSGGGSMLWLVIALIAVIVILLIVLIIVATRKKKNRDE